MNRLWKSGLFVAMLLCVGCGSSVEGASIVRGPYLQLGTPTSMVVRWRTDVQTSSRVDYGLSREQLGQTVIKNEWVTEHEVWITGLKPGTKYYYAVGDGTEILAGGDLEHFFVTSPPVGLPTPTRIWLLGDSGTANDDARAVRNAFLANGGSGPPDLWIMLGDNAYPNGTDSEYQAAVFDMYPSALAQSALWPTLGNHDGHTSDSATETGPYYDSFSLPGAAQAGGIASGTEAYYSFDYGDIHFVCLESYETDRSPSGAMLTWLEEDLAQTAQRWIIAFWHHPPYSKGSHNSDSDTRMTEMRENVLPILDSYGVDLVLSGHSHSYERSFLLDGHYGTSDTLQPSMILDGGDGRVDGDGAYEKPSSGNAAIREGAVYVVAGSSGKTGGGSLNHSVMLTSFSLLGSGILEIDGNRLRLLSLDASGVVRDRFTILKGADLDAPRLVSATADLAAPTEVTVRFSEEVGVASATNPGNYSLNPALPIASATLGVDGKSVVLMTTELSPAEIYQLTAPGVQDLQGNPVGSASVVELRLWSQAQVAFQDGAAPDASYAGTRDTTLRENKPDKNEGALDTIFMDGDDPFLSGKDVAALVAWDLSSIPAGARAHGASIAFNVTNGSSKVYEIYAMNRPWNEMEATWNRFATGAGWQTGGATGLLDQGVTLLGTVEAPNTGQIVVPLNPRGVRVVQDWIDFPAENQGFVLRNGSARNGLDLSSSEASAVALRPRLELQLALPGTATVAVRSPS